ncbi:MAG: ABC transporter permease subunit [Eubacteriales bacterium]
MARGTTKQSSGRRRTISYAKYGYYFILPFFVVYLIFSLTPLISTFWYSSTNIGDSNSNFNGFSNTEVYYDQYLDLKALYSKDFEKDVGITAKDYSKVKAYFSLQKIIKEQDPFNESGMQAIASQTDLSDSSKASIQAYMASKDPTALDAATLKDLDTYIKNNKSLDVNITKELQDVIKSVDAVKNAVVTEPAVAAADTAVTPEQDIIDQIPAVIDELNALKDAGKTSDNKTAVMAVEYYAAKLNGGKAPSDAFAYLVKYYGSVADTTISVHDYGFYTTTVGLVKYAAVTTDFTAGIKAILASNDWLTTINSLSSISLLQSYADAKTDLHSEQLYADLKALSDAGIISGETLIEENGALVVDSGNGILGDLRKLIDTNYKSDITKTKAVAQIRKLLIYMNDKTYRAVLANVAEIKSAGGIDSFMNLTGTRSTDTTKYLAFKSSIGLSDSLNLSKYEGLDSTRKADNVAAAEKKLADFTAKLPDAQAKYDAALAGGDAKAINTAKEALATVQVGIRAASQDIKSPSGIFTVANAKSSFIFVGLDNYKSIFTDPTRFNKVFGDLLTTLTMWTMNFIPQLLLALLLAAWMTDNRLHLKGMNTMKALIYLPNVMTAAAIAIFFYRAFQYSTNPAAKSMAQLVLKAFGNDAGFNFFASPWAARTIVAFINFWMWYGNTMIILIAGITSVSLSLFESAQIDGATNSQLFRKITLPLIRPIMLYTLVNSVIGGLQMYDIPKLLANGEPTIMFRGTKLKSTETILMYIQDQAFGPKSNHQIGVAAAASIILFAVTALFSALLFYLMRDKDASRLRKLAKRGGVAK